MASNHQDTLAVEDVEPITVEDDVTSKANPDKTTTSIVEESPREGDEGPVEGKKEYTPPELSLIIILLLVFSTVAQNFASSITSMFMSFALGYTSKDITRYWAYIGFISWVQPGVGFLADVIVVAGERRRPLFVFGALVNVVIYILYCFVPSVTENWGSFVGVSILAQICLMCIYISLNGLLVDYGRDENESKEESAARIGAIMSKAMMWRSLGSFLSSVILTYILVYLDTKATIGITSAFYFIIIPLIFFAPRSLFLRKLDQPNAFQRAWKAALEIKRTFNIFDYRSDGVVFVLVLCFVFIYSMVPDSTNLYYYFLYSEYWYFPTWFFSFMSAFGNLGSSFGAFLFSLWMDRRAKAESKGGKKVSNFLLFFFGSVAWAVAYATNLMLCTGFVENDLHIPANTFVPVDNFIFSLLARFAYMPTVAVAADHAPRAFEATCFEVFMVVSMGGAMVSNIFIIFIMDAIDPNGTYDNFWILVLISIAGRLLMIPLAFLLPDKRTTAENEALEADESDSVSKQDANSPIDDTRSAASNNGGQTNAPDGENRSMSSNKKTQ